MTKTQPLDPGSGDELGLADYARALARRWWVVAGATVVGALVGLLVSALSTPTYEATALIAVRTPLGDLPTPPMMTSTRKLLENHKAIGAALRGLGLESRVGVDEFVRTHLETRPVSDAPELLQILVRFEDPDLAARTANRLAEEVIALNRANAQRKTEVPAVIQERVDDSRRRVEQLEGELLRYRREHRTGRDELSADLTQLEREYEVARKVYETLASRSEETRIQMASRVPDLEIVDPAVRPARVSSPKTALNVATGAALGLLLSIAGVIAAAAISRIHL
jgi:uncharacterized protein involved in exopolysaccharide biosynthesis